MYSLHKRRKAAKGLSSPRNDDSKRRDLRDRLSEPAKRRVREWNADALNEEVRNTLRDGATKLLHPQLHHFRESNSKPNIYVRNYSPSEKRAQSQLEDYKASHLPIEPYKLSPIHLPDWLRPEDPKKQLSGRRLLYVKDRFKTQDQKSRMISTAKGQKGLVLEGYDLYAIESPRYRMQVKDDWVAEVLDT
mmetsp:Transcript_26553/g.47695  ORF Transcript_26553/g.47695 Transcript_26553/m.47695 type:complete len:190 (+) Transcript_26553:2391-2960(+)